ncbi:2-succinyl-6-hydroxy-2,4-cyclohexadiene-1-carboxylate synthase [Virgibacillus byunsanensis]|uniref:Putative 2-succinyl-6-hydroxy-2,4-cyclohexadiene-1-carboxylate synthase n=1 Tax=Virgibacillus byunsanensis TaxID=570945 RepID=A0ABW3LS74_9BACI
MRNDQLYYTINDASYWYEIHGEGTPVLMLHGFTGSISTWSNFVSNWKSEWQFIIIDLPGHGKTVTSTPRSMETFCLEMKQFLEYLNETPVHLVGYSMGGRTALSLAMLHPELIKSLVLESASPGLAYKDERKCRREHDDNLARRIMDEGMESFIDFWENISLFSTQKNLPLEKKQSVRDERLAQSEEGLAQSLRYMGTGSQPSWWKNLSQFTKPVLLVTGELDEKFTEINKRMKKQLSLAEFVICENAGHAIHVEKPEIFGKLVTEFISMNK